MITGSEDPPDPMLLWSYDSMVHCRTPMDTGAFEFWEALTLKPASDSVILSPAVPLILW